MPATINLNTLPGQVTHDDRGRSKTIEILGHELGRETVSVSTVAELRAAVQAFGARMRAAHPDASFMVGISVRAGQRKPNGYDKAYLSNGFGQDDFFRVIDKRTAAGAEPPRAAAAASALATPAA